MGIGHFRDLELKDIVGFQPHAWIGQDDIPTDISNPKKSNGRHRQKG